MKKLTLLLLLSGSLLCAKLVTVEGTGSYSILNDKVSECKTVAYENAKMDALGKIGTAVQTEFTLHESSEKKSLAVHDARVYSAGIMKSKIISTKVTDTTCTVTIEGTVDNSKMQEYLETSPYTKTKLDKLSKDYSKLISELSSLTDAVSDLKDSKIKSRNYIIKETNEKILVTIKSITSTKEKISKTIFDSSALKRQLEQSIASNNRFKQYADEAIVRYANTHYFKIEQIKVTPKGNQKFDFSFLLQGDTEKTEPREDNNYELSYGSKDFKLDFRWNTLHKNKFDIDKLSNYLRRFKFYAVVKIKGLDYNKIFLINDPEEVGEKYPYRGRQRTRKFCVDSGLYQENLMNKACYDLKSLTRITIKNIDAKDIDKMGDIDVKLVFSGSGYKGYFTDFNEYHKAVKDMI